ncbi:MAG: substrate-binding domain-containing protein [Butyrivibrio sp.]|nr:substrate-binding domain-containing protein [Butyrivibrio sp.]
MPAPIADIFQVTKVLEFQDIPVVSSDFDINVNKTYTLDELSDYLLITVPQDTQVTRLFDSWFLKSGKLLSPDYTVRSMSIVQTLTESGVGIGLLPEPLVHDKLVQLKTSTFPPKRSICIEINPVHDLSLTAQSFISLFNETISQK